MKPRGKKRHLSKQRGFLFLMKALSVLLASLVLVVWVLQSPCPTPLCGVSGVRGWLRACRADWPRCGLSVWAGTRQKRRLVPMAAAPCIAMATHLFPPFPHSCQGRAPALLASTQAQKNPSPNKTPFHWSLSPQATALSLMTVKAFTLSWTEYSLEKSLPCYCSPVFEEAL